MGTESQKIVIAESVVLPVGSSPTWDNTAFDKAIEDKGYEVNIFRALKCPCQEQATGQAASDCLNCGGTGWFFIDKQVAQILCSSMANRNKTENWTQENSGTVNITTRPHDKLGYMDMVVMVELEMFWSERLLLFINPTVKPETFFSFFIYQPVNVFEVYLFMDKTKPLIFLTPDKYTIAQNKITILKSVIDSYNISYVDYPTITIRYSFNPTYHIIDINRDLIKQKTALNCATPASNAKVNYPLNCVGKLAQWILKAPNYDGVGLIDNTNYNRIPPNYNR